MFNVGGFIKSKLLSGREEGGIPWYALSADELFFCIFFSISTILMDRLEIRSHHNTQKHSRNNGAIVLFGQRRRHTQSFKSKQSGKGNDGPKGRGCRQGGIPRDWEIRFWANCLASSSPDSFESRFPGVKPNRHLKRDDARIVLPFDFLFPSLVTRQWGSDGSSDIRLLLVMGITHRGRIYDGRGQINHGLYDLTSTLRSFPSGFLPFWQLLGIYRHLTRV